VAATCDGFRVRLVCDAQFNRPAATEAGPRGVFVVPMGTVGTIEDTEATRAYSDRAKLVGDDLVPVRLAGMVRYVPRSMLEAAR
jgi:hypothetical protein